MKTTLLEVGKNAIFPQFRKNLYNNINVTLAWDFGIDENVIEVKNNKDIKFLNQDLVNIALEAGRCIGQPKKHYLVLEMAASSPESRLLFIALFYSHPMVSTCGIEFDELFGST